MGLSNEFTVDAFKVAGLVPAKKRAVGKETLYTCPFCGKEKLYVNHADKIFDCKHCGESGGMLKFWAIYRGLEWGSFKEAYKDLLKCAEGSGVIENQRVFDTKESLKITKAAPDAELDRFYREFLSRLTLSKKHKENLSERGMKPETVNAGLYRTVPGEVKARQIVLAMKKAGYSFAGIPGFTDEKGYSNMVKIKPGYFVPVVSEEDHIKAMQIRYDVAKEGETRYKSFSSSYLEGGAEFPKGTMHVSKGNKKGYVIITEGAMKAEIIRRAFSITAIGLLGVSNTSGIEKVLSKVAEDGAKIIVAYDMDIIVKPQVKSAMERLGDKLIDAGYIPVSLARFDPDVWHHWKKVFNEDQKIKGLDDYLLYVSKTYGRSRLTNLRVRLFGTDV